MIHGQTVDGELVTLTDCFVSNSSFNQKQVGFSSESYFTHEIYIGDLLDTTTEFWKMSFSAQSLRKWTDVYINDSPGDLPFPVGPTEVESSVLDNADITLGMWQNTEKPMPSHPKSAYLSVWLDSPLTADDLVNRYLIPFRNFLTLGIGKVAFPTSITLFTKKYGSPDVSIKYYYYYYYDKYSRDQEEIEPMRMDYTLQDIDFAVSVKNWFSSFPNTLGCITNFSEQK